MTTGFYAGTFDPITNGHVDIIQRSAKLFNLLVIGVSRNSSKQPWFTLEERLQHIRTITQDLNNVKVVGYSGLLVDAAVASKADVIVRGLRSVTDFEFEHPISNINYDLNPNLETIYLSSRAEHSYFSSSLVKNTFSHGGKVKNYVPDIIYRELLKRDSLKIKG